MSTARRTIAATAIAIALVGCSGNPSTPTTAATPIDTVTTLPTSTTATVVTEASGWAPPPVPSGLDTGYGQLLGPYADVILRGGQVPWGSEEHMNYIVSCIRSAGFDVEPEVEGGTTGYRVVAGPQGTQLSEVQSACEQAAADAGLVGELPTTKSREFLTALYQAATFEYQCLVEHGFNPTEPPSEEWYIDNGGAWDPFADLPIEEYYAAEDVCTRNTVEILEQIVASGQATTP